MKLLIITPRFPYPLEKGDKLRIFYQLKYLSQFHEIILIAISHQDVSPESEEELAKYCQRIYILKRSFVDNLVQIGLGLLDGLPFQVSFFYHRTLRNKIHNIIFQEDPDHVYCQLIRVAGYVKDLPYRKSIDFMDCFSLSTSRRAEKSSVFLKWLLKWEAAKVRSYEKEVFFDFNHHFVISEHDKNAFSFHSKRLMNVIPNGLDLSRFTPLTDIKKKYDLVFVGNMGYHPNIEAAIYLCTKILPELPENTSVLIAGARPDKSVLRLANNQVTVSGWVDDIRKAYQSGSIFVAPIFEGAGLQNKVLEAMYLEVPCVITPVVANGLNCIPEKHLLLGIDVPSFVRQINRLWGDPDYAQDLILQAKRFVKNQYSWELFNEKLNKVITSEYDAFNRKRTKDAVG